MVEVLTPDDTLVALARAGDLQARKELIVRHEAMAYRVARRLLGDDSDAQDAVQEAWIKALRHMADFDGRSGFKTWLMTIVKNAAFDVGRKRKRRLTLPLDTGNDEDASIAIAQDDDPALGLHREDLKRALDAALARLSPTLRTTFVLFAEAEFSYNEIAQALEIPVGTVMSRIHQARQKLQSFLADVERRISD